MPTSSQLRNALAYMSITVLVLVFLNIYSARATRDLMFKAKCSSSQDKLKVVTSSFSGVDALTQETTEQIISVIGDMNVTRLLVTDAAGRTLYDSVPGQSAAGKMVLLQQVVQALEGNDVFCCVYEDHTLKSYAAAPILTHDTAGRLRVYDGIRRLAGRHHREPRADDLPRLAGADRHPVFVRGRLFHDGLGAHAADPDLHAARARGRIQPQDPDARLGRIRHARHRVQQAHRQAPADGDRPQRQFVSDASHELKTPLASIKLLSDSILQNEMDADTMREFVADIGAESDRLTRMAQKLLTLSRASADETEGGEHEVVDMGRTLSRVFRMLVPLADRQTVELTASVEKGCTILSFEDDAYQILFNLVENGIKYNREGGSVHVRVRHADDTVVIDVEDTGTGIPESALPSIFNRFYRVDKARSRQAGGAGLGLSIVHEMVGRNFGTIEVTSKVGEGSRFTVTFPSFGSGEEDDGDA